MTRTLERSNRRCLPACPMGNVDSLEWRETPYTASLVEFHPPCSSPECFPQEAPDPSSLDVVIRSRHYPTVFHRPRSDCADEVSSNDSTDRFADSEPESLTSITELSLGDGVVWGASKLPLIVEETTSDPSGEITLRGPDGGEYFLEGRPDGTDAVYPGYGCVPGLQRLPSDSPEEQKCQHTSDRETDNEIERQPRFTVSST